MKLKRFQGTGIHGYLNYDLTFNEDLTFFTGINGSGKSSILNLIEAFLMPRVDYLVLLKFDSLELTIEVFGKSVKLKAIGGNGKTVVTCSKYPNAKLVLDLKLITGLFDLHSNTHSDNCEIVQRIQEYFLEKMGNNKVFTYLNELPCPTVLGLERVISSTKLFHDTENKNFRNMSPRNNFNSSSADGLTSALELAKNSITICYQRNNELNKRMQKELVKVLLENTDKTDQKQKSSLDMDEMVEKSFAARRELEIVSDKILKFSDEIFYGFEPFINFINEQIGELNDVIHFDVSVLDRRNNRIKKMNNIYSKINFEKISAISKYINEYINENTKIFQKINGFINSINKFYSECNKFISYDESGILQYVRTNNGSKKQVPLSLRTLSSGEIQLIILFAHLYFGTVADNGNVLLFDEPEISLHISWQEKFVDEIMEAAQNTQIIMATHAPTIIMNRIDYCNEISANNP